MRNWFFNVLHSCSENVSYNLAGSVFNMRAVVFGVFRARSYQEAKAAQDGDTSMPDASTAEAELLRTDLCDVMKYHIVSYNQ